MQRSVLSPKLTAFSREPLVLPIEEVASEMSIADVACAGLLLNASRGAPLAGVNCV